MDSKPKAICKAAAGKYRFPDHDIALQPCCCSVTCCSVMAEQIIDDMEEDKGDGSVSLVAKARGRGKHQIVLRLFNCETSEVSRPVVFKGNEELTLEWRLRVQDKLKPWIAVASADSAPDLRQEAFGRLGSYPELS